MFFTGGIIDCSNASYLHATAAYSYDKYMSQPGSLAFDDYAEYFEQVRIITDIFPGLCVDSFIK